MYRFRLPLMIKRAVCPTWLIPAYTTTDPPLNQTPDSSVTFGLSETSSKQYRRVSEGVATVGEYASKSVDFSDRTIA